MNIGKKKEKQTFIVDIIDHQKYTWQGQLYWVQGNKKILFRSVMEMLHLMDSVITDEEDDICQEAETTEER